jgi:hypothetical protein
MRTTLRAMRSQELSIIDVMCHRTYHYCHSQLCNYARYKSVSVRNNSERLIILINWILKLL